MAGKGGLRAEYPSLEPGRLSNDEDLEHTIDFRGVYATLLEQWMGVEAAPIVGGNFEQLRVFSSSQGYVTADRHRTTNIAAHRMMR